MVCANCSSIELDWLLNCQRLPHHATLGELKLCAESGACAACTLLLENFEYEVEERALPWDRCERSGIYFRVPRYVFYEFGEDSKWHGIKDVRFELGSVGVDIPSTMAEFFVSGDSHLGLTNQISGRPIAKRADDNSCFELVKRWMNNCLAGHGDSCLGNEEHTFPTRVIDVGPADGSQDPWLRETRLEKGKWVALSHCWGTEIHFVTDPKNLGSRQRSIPIGSMPPTFRDAVIITRALGFRFLWIDSLCILQDDHQDWARESPRMRDYYKNAIVTVSADSASGDHVGFLQQQRSAAEEAFVITTSGERVGIRSKVWCPKFIKRDTLLASRAWTLQEFVVSPRSLLYTGNQLVWECHTRKLCESDENFQEQDVGDLYNNLKRHFATPQNANEHLSDYIYYLEPSYRWYTLVNDYFFRSLKLQKDTFPAISGLAREIQQHTGNTYAAGIWVEDFHRGLLWRLRGNAMKREDTNAPSWSWAYYRPLPSEYWDATGMYNNSAFTRPEVVGHRATLVSFCVIPLDNDPFGCISFSSLVLRGRLLQPGQWRSPTEPHFNAFDNLNRVEYYFAKTIKDQLVCHFDVVDPDCTQQDRLNAATLFQISTWEWELEHSNAVITCALLLSPVNGQPNTYRRIGMAEIPNVNGLAEDGWEMADVLLI